MNTTTDTRDPAEIEREIQKTQNDLSATVNKIGDQMSPKNIMNSLLDTADANGVDARYLLDGARRNPLALALISAGAIWLVSDYDAKPPKLSSGTDNPELPKSSFDWDRRDYVDHMAKVTRQPEDDDTTYQRRRDEHRGTYLMLERGHDEDHTTFRQRLDQAFEGMRSKGGDLSHAAQDRGQAVAETGRRAAQKGQQMYQDNPLLGGLAAALVGALVGSAVPVSRIEREQLGSTGAKALDLAGEKAHQIGDVIRDKKDELVEKADRKLTEQNTASDPMQSQPGMPTPQRAFT